VAIRRRVLLLGGPRNGHSWEVLGYPPVLTVTYNPRPNSSKIVPPLPTATYRKTGRRNVYRYVEPSNVSVPS
jgi:hypothetical protein